MVETVGGVIRPGSASGMIIGPTDRRVVDSDAWELSLFWLPVGIFTKPPIPTYPLEEAIEAGTVVFLDREPHGESQDIHMRIIVPPVSLDETDQPRRYEVWVDQKRNWLIRKAVHTIENRDGSALWEVSAEVTDLLEIKPTVYVPTTCAITTKYRGKTITKAIATFKDVKVNEAMSAIPPMPAVPQGSVVINEIDGTVWRTDAKGGPVGKPRHIIADYSPPVSVDPPPPRGSLWTIAAWLLLSAGLLLAVASTVLWRNRTPEA